MKKEHFKTKTTYIIELFAEYTENGVTIYRKGDHIKVELGDARKAAMNGFYDMPTSDDGKTTTTLPCRVFRKTVTYDLMGGSEKEKNDKDEQ